MKFVLFRSAPDADLVPGILTTDGIIPIADLIDPGCTGQAAMRSVIERFSADRAPFDARALAGPVIEPESVSLGPPLPRPGKILGCIGNYWEHAQRESGDLNMFLKNADAVVGPGDVIRLPSFTEPSSFMHEAELALVFKGPAKDVTAQNWRDAIFGYTAAIDVTARGDGRYTWKKLSWLGKSFDTFAPLGPCIVTADEIDDPNNLHIRFWNDGELRHNYITDDMEHHVPEIVRFITSLMTMHSGDVILCGTNHEGLGYLQDAEEVEIDIEGIGAMKLRVEDPLKRTWERGVYMGVNSTNREAVRRNRPLPQNDAPHDGVDAHEGTL